MAKPDEKPVKLTRDELNRKLWGAADILRGVADAGDYKNHILALLFLKRLSDVFYERREIVIEEWMQAGKTREQAEEIANDPDEYTKDSFFIPEGARWDDLMNVGENRAEAIDVAIRKIEEQNARYLENVLSTVHFNDQRRFGDPVEMDGLMQRLLTHFSKIPLGNRNLIDQDVLGNAYEYLIERFAESSGKKGGEFYTPRAVVRLIVEILKPQPSMRIHDPTCGSGGMLIESVKYIKDHGGNPKDVTLCGQEKNFGTMSMCKLNMILHGITDARIEGGDTIRNPKFIDGARLMRFDRVIANPPFSLKEWGHEYASGDEKGKDPNQPHDPYRRFERGVPPRTKGDMAFLLHMVEVCNDTGMVGVVMPHGVLFRGGTEAEIRRKLLEEDLFEAVIGLPEMLFFGTGIPASILILNKNKPEERKGKVLFIDASSEGFYRKDSARNFLEYVDLARIVTVYNAYADPNRVFSELEKLRQDLTQAVINSRDRLVASLNGNGKEFEEMYRRNAEIDFLMIEDGERKIRDWLETKSPSGRTALEKFAAVVTLEEIAEENDYNLNISRYVDSTEPPPQLDVAEELRKLRECEARRDEAEAEMDRLLKELGYEA